MVSNAILDYEPRIDLNNLTVSESEDQDGLLLISIDYTIRSTNSRYNMVYPFYLKEAARASLIAWRELTMADFVLLDNDIANFLPAFGAATVSRGAWNP